MTPTIHLLSRNAWKVYRGDPCLGMRIGTIVKTGRDTYEAFSARSSHLDSTVFPTLGDALESYSL